MEIKNNLSRFAYISGPANPKGVVLDFHGLGYGGMRQEPNQLDLELNVAGFLTVFPYYGPWSWMNFQAVHLVDELVEGVYVSYGLEPSVPLVSTGGSMGGMSALAYTRYAKRTPDACAVNCPVCDLEYHCSERPDVLRTVYLAYAHYDCGWELGMQLHSPIRQVAELPDIPYFVLAGTADDQVHKAQHADPFVKHMRNAGKQITYLEVPGMGHCDLANFPEAAKVYYAFIKKVGK